MVEVIASRRVELAAAVRTATKELLTAGGLYGGGGGCRGSSTGAQGIIVITYTP